MTDEERGIITSFIERVSGAARPSPSVGSVPMTVQALPPVDPEADRLIADLFQRYPEARYRLTQTAFVQEHALAEAQTRMSQMQAELQQLRNAAPAQAAPTSGGFFHSLFGGGRSQPQPPQGQPSAAWQQQPQPQYAQPQYAQPQYAQPQYAQPQYAPQQPGMFQRSGSGFLGSALTTAAGVAGGMVAGNALMNLFEGRHEYGGGYEGGGFGGGGFGGPGYETGGPWAQPGLPDAPASGSAWDNLTEDGQPSTWDQGGDQGGAPDPAAGGGWDAGGDMGGGDSGGGWDDNSSGGF